MDKLNVEVYVPGYVRQPTVTRHAFVTDLKDGQWSLGSLGPEELGPLDAEAEKIAKKGAVSTAESTPPNLPSLDAGGRF
jgi:hypothetical protein